VETRRKTLARKKAVVDGIREKLLSSQAALLVDFCGLTAEEMVVLRRKLKGAQSELKVVKNTLALRASEGTSLSQASDFFKGPTALVFGYQDPVETAKVLVKFAREAEALKLKGGIVEGKLFGPEGVEELSRLPSREILLATLLATLNSPVSGLVNVLAANLRGLLNVLNGIAEKKEKEA
jgi:large subunit ribosomal protein L10